MWALVLQVCKLSYNREGFSEVEPCIMLLHVNFLLFYFSPSCSRFALKFLWFSCFDNRGPAKFLLTQLNSAIDEVSAQLHPEDAASGIAVASDEIQASIQEISVEISMQASIIAQNILFSIGLFLWNLFSSLCFLWLNLVCFKQYP